MRVVYSRESDDTDFIIVLKEPKKAFVFWGSVTAWWQGQGKCVETVFVEVLYWQLQLGNYTSLSLSSKLLGQTYQPLALSRYNMPFICCRLLDRAVSCYHQSCTAGTF